MRIMVFFDLPVKTKPQRRAATRFRNFLLKDGYHMVQYSVYARVCNGTDSVETHKARLQKALPGRGAVRMMVVTEKQFNAIDVVLGEKTVYDEPQNKQQLMEF
jgi:CRISPR-associated protein Cas2